MSDLWYVYILRCSDNSLYTGIATDVDRRLEEHNNDNGLGAKYTRTRRPATLVYQEEVKTRSEATKREYAIRKLSKQDKEALVNTYAKS
ncbi:GIY-YIG nuclease family protein [Kaarinaea lacus]